MKTYSTEDQLYQLYALLRRTTHLIIKTRNTELHPYGISSIEAAVLQISYDMDGKATASEISRQITREPHTISSLLERMEAKGLIKKTKGNGRKVMISLTEKGREVYQLSMKLESVRNIMAVLSEKDREKLASILLKVREKALKELVNRRRPPFSI